MKDFDSILLYDVSCSPHLSYKLLDVWPIYFPLCFKDLSKLNSASHKFHTPSYITLLTLNIELPLIWELEQGVQSDLWHLEEEMLLLNMLDRGFPLRSTNLTWYPVDLANLGSILAISLSNFEPLEL